MNTSKKELLTPRLCLRIWQREDLESLHRIWSNPETIWWGPSTSLEQTLEVMKAIETQHSWWAVTHGTEIIGNVFLRPSRRRPDALELGYHFLPSAWGHGFATEASQRVLDDAPEIEIEATIVPDNIRSQSVVKKLRFHKTGQLMHADKLHDLWIRNSTQLR